MSEPAPAPKKQVFCCCCIPREREEPEAVATALNSTEAAPAVAKVPFSADLPADLSIGKAICVTGTVLPKCSRFAVNLTCGRSPNSDVAFHLNPRLLQRYVVRNTRLNGHWGIEEKTSTVKFPFSRTNTNFLLSILVCEKEFLVSVDGIHVCSYAFRVPWEKITRIEVQGEVDVVNVEYKSLEKYPEIGKHTPEARIVEGSKENTDSGLKTGMDTPVTFLLLEGFQRNCQLEIYGRVKILPHSFYVNLQGGSQRWPRPKIPLHLNPRFGLDSGEPLFVRNAWIDNGWGQEERTPGFQFKPGSPFIMAIRRESDHFSVWIDGKLAGEFKFRGGVDDIDTIYIEGDVVIFDVCMTKDSDKKAPLAVVA
ncbi:galectin-8-like [Zophobas morio]|uniref:galectin-8-like n=1 Tax=Zophobas morio TaxID=2755281 RepID=UPI003083ED5D